MKITIQHIDEAAKRLKGVALHSPLQYAKRLSKRYGAHVYLKREDLQEVRSYKIRGAYNKISSLSDTEKQQGVVAASAGNHAQGVAYSCSFLHVKGVIFMPVSTPNQKIERVKHFGENFVEIKLVGNTYDEASNASKQYSKENKMIYIHPFDDPLTIAGQGTVGKEIYDELPIDILVAPIGGGGFISGAASYLKQKNPHIKIVGVEPLGAPAMYESLRHNKVVTLETIDTFVDGCAVQTVGQLGFTLCKKLVKEVLLIPEGKVCQTMIELYQNEGIVAEPAGVLSIAALDDIAADITGKTVVCVLSGGNNDILRYPEIMERSLVYQGRKHYFIVEFAQKPGQLRQFVDKALGPTDDIVRFEYIKKTNRGKGAALIGIELMDKKDLDPLIIRMKQTEMECRVLSSEELLYNYLI